MYFQVLSEEGWYCFRELVTESNHDVHLITKPYLFSFFRTKDLLPTSFLSLVIPSAESVVTKTCLESEYRCSTNRLCIQKSWLCDGTTDCPNKEDETPKVCLAQKCKSSEFQCSNGQCTPKRYHCDGVSDCFDKSDEANCSKCVFTHNIFLDIEKK